MTSSAIPSATRSSGRAGAGVVLDVLSILAIVLALWASWRRLPAVWTNDRSHGYAIALLCLWVIWRDRTELRRLDPPVPGAALLLLGVSLLWMVAVSLSAQVVHLALAPVIMLIWLLVVRGERAARYGLQIVAAFFLAVPVWEALTAPLQMLTVLANTALVFVTRIPARIEGTMIHLSAGTLQVAYSCAGINYLMSGLTLGAGYAFLFTTPWRTRLKIVLAAGAVSILSNWVRVFGLVVIGHVTDMRSSLMQDHVVYGWIVFAAFLPLFFHFARRIEVKDAAKGSLTVRHSGHDEPRPAPRRLAVATSAAMFGPLAYLLLSQSQQSTAATAEASGVSMPVSYTAVSPAALPWRAEFSGEERHLAGSLQVEGLTVQVERFIYARQEQSAEMVSGENRLAADSLIAGEGVAGPLDDKLRSVREVAVRTPDTNGRLVWFWYHVSGVDTPSANKAKLLEFWAFLKRKPSSEIVVMSAPCAMRECVAARKALFRAATGREMPGSSQR